MIATRRSLLAAITEKKESTKMAGVYGEINSRVDFHRVLHEASIIARGIRVRKQYQRRAMMPSGSAEACFRLLQGEACLAALILA
jgi:hypothetical protein